MRTTRSATANSGLWPQQLERGPYRVASVLASTDGPAYHFQRRSDVTSEPLSPRRRVLVADDNADLARLLGELIRLDPVLEFAGYVQSGTEAIEQARHGVADVLVLDLGLRDINGLQVLERLTAESCGVKVIIHTGHAFEGLDGWVKSKGAAGYVLKDGNPESLLNAIRTA